MSNNPATERAVTRICPFIRHKKIDYMYQGGSANDHQRLPHSETMWLGNCLQNVCMAYTREGECSLCKERTLPGLS